MSRRSVIDEANAKVQVIDLADRLCGPGKMRRMGVEWVGRCPHPDHEDRVPSFTVNLERNVWFCHGCLVGGDVVELARHVWSYDKAEVATAAAMLLMEFGHEIPPRSEIWFRKQKRQRPVRVELERVRMRSARRRLFRVFEPMIASIADEGERRAEAELIWAELDLPARLMVEGRGG